MRVALTLYFFSKLTPFEYNVVLNSFGKNIQKMMIFVNEVIFTINKEMNGKLHNAYSIKLRMRKL